MDPDKGGAYPLCPSKALFGVDCPACGGLRGTNALLHGRIGEALAMRWSAVDVCSLAVICRWRRILARSAISRSSGDSFASAERAAPNAISSANSAIRGPASVKSFAVRRSVI